jgi:hypothetical protein
MRLILILSRSQFRSDDFSHRGKKASNVATTKRFGDLLILATLAFLVAACSSLEVNQPASNQAVAVTTTVASPVAPTQAQPTATTMVKPTSSEPPATLAPTDEPTPSQAAAEATASLAPTATVVEPEPSPSPTLAVVEAAPTEKKMMATEEALTEPGPTAEQAQLLATLNSRGLAPELTNEVWLNSERLTLEGLRGKVVLIEFWTFG